MRIIFLGSPAFALPSLEALVASRHEILAVITQPDRPSGRGHGATPPPVKVAALAHGLAVLQPENVSVPEQVEALKELAPDVFVVAAYGQILRQRLLDVPNRGSVNVHASLLPRHRGASPIAAAILAGDKEAGVTLMEVVRALDAGPMISRVSLPIEDSDTAGSLEAKLAVAGANLLVASLEPWAKGAIIAEPQDDALSTYAPMLKREQAEIDWNKPAVELWREVRAFNPWPVAFTRFRGIEMKLWETAVIEGDSGKAEGTILPPDRDGASEGFNVQTGRGRLAVRRLQMAGKKALAGADFLRGQRDLIGSRLG